MDRKREVLLKSSSLKARERSGNKLTCKVSIVNNSVLYSSKLLRKKRNEFQRDFLQINDKYVRF